MLSWISGNSFNTNEYSSRQSSLSGYLYKMKRQRKLLVPQWNRRWFSIEGRFFRWYENAHSEEPSGTIDLKKVSYISRFEMQGAYSFIVGYPDRNLMLRAETVEGMEKWIRALQLQADVARGGDGTNMIIGGAPASPANRLRSSKKKSSSMEAELDRSLRQLQDLERQIQGKSGENTARLDSYSTTSSVVSSPLPMRTINRAPPAETAPPYNTVAGMTALAGSLSRRPSKNISNKSNERENSNSSSNKQPAGQIIGVEPTFTLMDAYPHLDDDAPKTGNIIVDTIDKSSTVYSTLSKTSSKSSSLAANIASGKLSKSDSHESLEEIVDRPVRRVPSRQISRPSSGESKENPLSNRSSANGSHRMPSSQAPARITSSKNAITGSLTPASSIGTENETLSGRSTSSQGKGYANIPRASYKGDYKSISRDADDYEIQEINPYVKPSSRPSSHSGRRTAGTISTTNSSDSGSRAW
jgi:hypothetical protein